MLSGLFRRKISGTERDACVDYLRKELVFREFARREIILHNDTADDRGEAEQENNRLYTAAKEVCDRINTEILSVPVAARSVRSAFQTLSNLVLQLTSIRAGVQAPPKGYSVASFTYRLNSRWQSAIQTSSKELLRFVKRLGMPSEELSDLFTEAKLEVDKFDWKTWREFNNAETQETTNTPEELFSPIQGAELLQNVVDEAYQVLAPGRTEDVYRASLIGGLVGVETILGLDPVLRNLWGSGNPEKAHNIVEVWTSTLAVYLLQQQPNQEAVTEGVAVGLASIVFESDENVALAELRAYQGQRLADERIRAEGNTGGTGYYASTLIYLRCLRALGRQIDFTRFPIPVKSLEELVGDGLVAARDLGSPETIIVIPAILVDSLRRARTAFDSL